jgi:hypothetical protein
VARVGKMKSTAALAHCRITLMLLSLADWQTVAVTAPRQEAFKESS